MPKRGSVQLLLLSFRPRATLGWGIGAAAIFLVLAGALYVREVFPLFEKTGLAQVLRQSAWERALADQARPEHWPWEDMSVNMSLAPTAKVPRLGLSAAILKRTAVAQDEPVPQPREAKAHRASAGLGDVAIGDSLTVTDAGGASHVYKVTGRRVVDPHLADSGAELSDGEVSLVTCGPLDPLMADSLRVVIQATQATKAEPATPPRLSGSQQKL